MEESLNISTLNPELLITRNPATGEILQEIPRTSPTQVQGALALARESFASWVHLPLEQRASYLLALRRVLQREASSLAKLITKEIGKPVLESYGADLLTSLDALQELARSGRSWLAARKISRRWWDFLRGNKGMYVLHEPLGVIGIIGTWNYPLQITVLQIASALLCGNSVLWKPSELALATADRLARCFQEAGFPRGVFSALPGDGTTGEALTQAGCDKIVFTGSRKIGRAILEQLALNGTPSVMELSGMDAALVCRDAAIPQAARALCWGGMTNAGQSCLAPKRIIVHQAVAERFTQALVQRVQALRVGDPMAPDTEVGPVRSQEILDRLEGLVDRALQQGARLLTGGGRLPDARGYFFQPTVLTDLTSSMEILREEFFGPVLMIQTASDEREMIRMANDSQYGLGASIWSLNILNAERMARKLDAGFVGINDVLASAADVRLPLGGVKASGFGRVHGVEGLREFTRIKTVDVNRPIGFRPYYFPYHLKKLERLKGFLKRK